jgi:hypothetical protein
MTKCTVCGSANVSQRVDSYVCLECGYDSLTNMTVAEGWNKIRPMIEELLNIGIERGQLTEATKQYILENEWNGIYNTAIEAMKDNMREGMGDTPNMDEQQIELFKRLFSKMK